MRTDSKIKEDVIDELLWDPILKRDKILAEVKSQIVTLSGTVDSFCKKSIAEKAARRVLGVKEVVLNISIDPAIVGKSKDEEITRAVTGIFKWDSLVPDAAIKVLIKNGLVTLLGEVQWEFQRTAAYCAIKNIAGITDIINNIKISPEHSPHNIKEKIGAALKRSASVDAENINVEIKGSKILLSGTAHSWCEKADAEKAAFSAPGVTEVESKILVDTEIPVY